MFNAVDPAEERDDGLVARMARLVGGMPRRGPALLDAWRAPAAPQPQPSALVDAIPKEIPSLYDAQDRPTPQLPKPSLIDKSAAALSNSMWQQGPTAWPQAVASPVNRLWQTLKDSADVAGRKLGLPDWMLERKTFDPVGSFTTGAERLAGRLADAGSDFGRGMIERDPAGRAAMNEIRGDVGRFQSIQDRMMAGDMKAASELTDPRLMLPNMSSLVPSLVSGYVMGPWKGAAVSTMADAAQELRQHEQETGKAVSPAEAAKFFATRAIEIPSEALSNKLTLAPKPGIGRVPAAVTATLADPATEAWQRWLENLAMKSTFKPDQSLTEGLLQEAAGAGPGSGAVAAFTAKPSVADARSAQAPAYRPTDLTAAMLDAIRTQGALNAPQQINQQPGPLPQRRGTGIELQADRTDRQLPPPDAGGGGETGIGNRVPGAAGGAQTALTDRAQFNYEPSRGLSDEERAIEQRFAQSIGSDVDRAVANYERANTQNGTLVINTDQARDLSEDYNRDIESRSLYAAAVHEPASALVKKVWRAALDRPPAPGKEANVIFTAGGTGAGKTTAIDNVPAIAQLRDASDIIYDGNLNNFDKAVQRIEEALASGRTADIVYVYRDPVEAMRNGALTRAERQGRTVRIDAHADSHIGSLKVVGQLMEHYKGDPRVNIVVLDNSHGPGGAVETTIDKLPAWEYDALAQELINVVQADYEAGRISDRVYRGTLGQRAAIPRGTEPRLQEGDSGKPQPQRTLQPEEATAEQDRAQGVGEASAFYGRNAIDSLEVGSNKSDHPAIDYRLPPSMGQRRNVNPPDSTHQRMLNAAAHDIEAAGFPLRAAMQAVKGVVTYNGSYSNWHAAWLPDHRVVAFSKMRLIEMEGADARQRYLRGWMAHELTHAIDDAGNGSISSGSPRLDFFVAGDTVVTKGDIVTEVAEAYTKGGKIGEFFEYPFAYAKEFSPALMKEELLAQLSRLYTTNRELMRKELPASFKMMEEWYAQIQPDSLAATRAGLQAALRAPGARLGGQERQFHGIDQAVPRADRGVLGVGQPGAGVATGRATATGGQGAVTGAQPDLFQSAYSGEKYAVNLNLDRYDTAGAIKGLIEATAKNITDKSSRGETATHEKTLAEADRLGISEDQVLAEARKGGKPMSLAEARAYALAVRQLIVTRAEATKHYAETAFKSGNSQDRAEAMASLYHLAALQAVGMNLSAEAGRLLNSYRILAGVTTGDRMSDSVFDEERQKTAEQVLEQMFGGTNNIDDILSKVALMSTQQLASPKMRKALLSRRPSAFLEIWKAGLLSGPQTHIVNMASNALTSLIRAPETAVAAVIGKLHGGDKVYFRETAALMAGMTAGTMIGARDAWQIMRYGEDANAAGKSETTGKAITGENFGLTGRVGKAVDVAGEVVRTPFRALAAEDAIFKGVNRTGTLYALAYRQAIKEGAKNVSMRARELVANPTRKMTKAALEDGLYFTFNNQLGTAGQKMLDILHSTRIGKLAQFAVVPFFRTPVNILKFGIHRSPLAPLTQHFQDEIKAGGARRDMAIAQMMTGTAIMTAVFSLAASGLVTGGGEPEKERKAADRIAGWRPYSIRIGNKFFEYRRLEPLGMLLGMAADIYELSDYMSREESEQWVKMAGMAMAQNVTSKTFLQQLTNLMKAISEPQQYGDNYLGAMVGSFVPGVVAQAARARDPWERDTDPDKNLNGLAYAWDDVKRDIMARIPGQREKLPLRRDALGQPMPITDSPSMFNPIRTGELRTGDPVAMELASARARVSPAKDTIKGVRLTPEEKEAYGQASGTVARARLERLFASPGYQALPEFLKDEKISKEMAKARTDVRNAIVQGLPVERRVEAKVRQLRR